MVFRAYDSTVRTEVGDMVCLDDVQILFLHSQISGIWNHYIEQLQDADIMLQQKRVCVFV